VRASNWVCWLAMKRSGRKYIDRRGNINEKSRLPNVMPGLRAVACSSHHRSIESRFSYKLTNTMHDTTILDVLVLPNDICVIRPPIGIGLQPEQSAVPAAARVASIKLLISLSSEQISGKFKKQAPVLTAGSEVIQVSYHDGTSYRYRCPVGGQLLEIHDMLSSPSSSSSSSSSGPSSSRVWDQIDYVCIILPNTKIPSIYGNVCSYEELVAQINLKRNDRSCYAWKLGNCNRGDSCKFLHAVVAAEAESLVIGQQQQMADDSAGINDAEEDGQTIDEADNSAHKKQKLDH
jgi:hypothetical protein